MLTPGCACRNSASDWAIAQCREKGCELVQLAMDKTRTDTLRFYESLGFKASHEGMKLDLTKL